MSEQRRETQRKHTEWSVLRPDGKRVLFDNRHGTARNDAREHADHINKQAVKLGVTDYEAASQSREVLVITVVTTRAGRWS